ncbi:MAG: SagB/ThcOx family dehydrogenase [Acidobacteria bacterium]|nr:SagB/ThcOx family dehydrogenase [Acidobacteriota bacterium]
MKRRKLLRHLEAHGCEFLREDLQVPRPDTVRPWCWIRSVISGSQRPSSRTRRHSRCSFDVKIEQQLRIRPGISGAHLSAMTWREYHGSTKHSVESLRRAPHVLDWSNMPGPFRHYEGVPVLDLPADLPVPETPALEVLHGVSGATPASDGSTFLSQLLFCSAAISASKRVPSTGYRYALRVNPSSGNLHPTEFHFLTRGLKKWPDGLYHYRPSAHMAEQRALGDLERKPAGSPAPIVFLLTSIAWREAWKYRDRAYRYCLHDMGHAWQALALAARAIGCDSFAVGHFPDDEVAQFWRLHEDEWPMLIVELRGRSVPVREPDACKTVWYGGHANQLSSERTAYTRIEGIHRATKLSNRACSGISAAEPAPTDSGEIKLPPPASSRRAFGEVARMRRSALDFQGGMQSMSLTQLSAILAVTARPLFADFAGARFIQLYLYSHRVDGLQPGVYRFWPEGAGLEQIKSGDQRVAAAGLSLGQEIAGNACVAFSMIGDLERAARAHGDRGYRYVHFEAGAIGHRLYLAAEALGLGATGIGAFYDDEVHRYLNLAPEQGQVVYHFAIGYPVPDPRLET